jgi:MscS family membrane protein
MDSTAASSTSPAGWLRSKLPESLQGSGFLLENWQWLGLLLLIVGGVILDRLVTMILARSARRAFARFLPNADAGIVPRVVRPAGMLAMSVAWWVGVRMLALPESVLGVLSVAVKLVFAASGVWMAYRLTDIVGEIFVQRASKTDSKLDDLLVPLIRKSLKIFIVAFGLVFVADNLNVDISSLLTGLGLGGLAFALAAQDTVKNLFGSLTVLMDKPFAVGDAIILGEIQGNVEEVGFRSTRIRTFHDSLITVPNADLINTAVENMTLRTFRRWRTTLSLTYDTPPEKIEAFCEGVRELIRHHPITRKESFQVWANEYSAASLDVLLNVFFRTRDLTEELRARHELFLDILRLARDLGVEFAFPTQTLHVHASDWTAAKHDLAPDAVERAMAEGKERAGAIAGARETTS